MFELYRQFFRRPSGRRLAATASRPTRARFTPMLTALDDRSLPATNVFSGSFELGGGAATVALTVTEDKDGFEGLYYWNYHLTNNAGSSDPDDYFKATSTFGLGAVAPEAIVDVFDSSEGWLGIVLVWNGDRMMGAGAENLLTGQSADFDFVTVPVTIVDIDAVYSDGDFGLYTGLVKGPGIPKATTTVLDVEAIWPDDSLVPTGLFLTAIVSGDYRLGDPTGTVEFWDGDTVLGTATLIGNGNGTAIATLITDGLSLGTHPIIAKYSGDVARKMSISPISFVNYWETVSESVVADSEEGRIGSDNGDGEWMDEEDLDGDDGELDGEDCAPPPVIPTSSTITVTDYKHVNPPKIFQAKTDIGFKATDIRVKFFGRNVDVDGRKAKAVSEAKYEVINFAAPFKPDTSYILKPLINDEVLFRHERLHLAIAEFMAQKAKDNFPMDMVGKGVFEGNMSGVEAQKRADGVAERNLYDQMEVWRKGFEAVIQAFVRKYDIDTENGRGTDQVNWETGNGYQAKALEFLKSKGYDK